MRTTLAVIISLFGAATVGILALNWQPLDSLGVAIALALLCVDQGRMALVDLSNIRQVTLKDKSVRQFHRVTLMTIALEVVGFYLAWIQLGLGTALVLVSQLFFNTLAKIQLYPSSLEPIQPFGWQERSSVILANTVALGLIVVWQLGQFRPIAAALLFTMVIVYLVVKYLPSRSTSTCERCRW